MTPNLDLNALRENADVPVTLTDALRLKEARDRIERDIAETCPTGSRWACALVGKRDLRLVLEALADREVLREALRDTKHVLTVPAAEYVPVITDAWAVIDAALEGKPWK